ncbi:MAG: M14 family metallopeptidase [Candidatus Aminicenantes bacterium]
MKKFILLTACISLLSLPLKSQNYADTDMVSVEKNPEVIKKIQPLNLDVLMVWKGRIYIIVYHEQDELSKLEQAQISYRIESQNFYPSCQKQLEGQEEMSVQGGVNGDYHSYQEVEEELMALEESYPQLAKLHDIGDSLEGRNIYAVKISDNAASDEQEAEVLFMGCHHAREWISVEVPLLLAKYLVENYDHDPLIKALVDQSQIWVVPVLNPDGLEYSIHFYRYWRKNRRDNGDGSYGVDLNRNYGYKWGYDNQGSSSNPYSNVYRGKSPFSEPETRAVEGLFLQRDFQALITYHNYSQIILYPWGYTRDPSPQDDLLLDLASEMSRLIQSVNGKFYGYGRAGESLYLTNGDTTDWALGVYGIPAYTIELPPVDQLQGGFFNAEEDIQLIFNENLPAALYLIQWSIEQHAYPPPPPPPSNGGILIWKHPQNRDDYKYLL